MVALLLLLLLLLLLVLLLSVWIEIVNSMDWNQNINIFGYLLFISARLFTNTCFVCMFRCQNTFKMYTKYNIQPTSQPVNPQADEKRKNPYQIHSIAHCWSRLMLKAYSINSPWRIFFRKKNLRKFEFKRRKNNL